MLIHVDDNGSRGSREHTTKFWQAVDEKYGLRHWNIIEHRESRKILGVNIFKNKIGDDTVFGMNQNEDVSAFVDEHLPLGSAAVKVPMPDKHEMYGDKEMLNEAGAKEFRSMLMSLSWFAQQTRLDIVTPVNILAQLSAKPTESALTTL